MSRIVMVPLSVLVLFSACDRAGPGRDGGPEATIPDSVRAELVAMGARDQAAREGLTPERLQDTLFLKEMLRGDSVRTRRLRSIVDRYGWPTEAGAGSEAADAAFLILQHSPEHEFQSSMLPTLEELTRDGEMPPSQVAMLVDRVLVQEGKPQRYGTQFSIEDGELVMDPVEDEEHLEERRRAMRLPPLEEYRRLLEEHYDTPAR